MDKTNKPKRQREDELEKHEDSMSSLISEFSQKSNRDIEDLCQFMTEYIQRSEEFRRTMHQVHFQYNELQERVKAVEANAASNSGKTMENAEHIEVIVNDVDKIKAATLENEATVNKLDQMRLDKHIYITGFPSKPDVEEVSQALMTLHDMTMDSVDLKYTFAFTPRNPKASSTPNGSNKRKTVHQMVIGFKDHQAKENFMKRKKEKGPIAFEQLTKSPLSSNHAKATIRCVNRLSKFNLKVQWHLMSSKIKGEIFSFQLHNGVFRLKQKEDSSWVTINTKEALEPYNEQAKEKKRKADEDSAAMQFN
jgi:hypothetical protein